jgi:hypothetical protein
LLWQRLGYGSLETHSEQPSAYYFVDALSRFEVNFNVLNLCTAAQRRHTAVHAFKKKMTSEKLHVRNQRRERGRWHGVKGAPKSGARSGTTGNDNLSAIVGPEQG